MFGFDDMLTGGLIGGGVGVGKSILDMLQYGQKKQLASATARYSPWTGLKPDMPDAPNILGDVAGGVASGMGTGQAYSKYKSDQALSDATNAWLTGNKPKGAESPFGSSVNIGAGAGSSWAQNPLGLDSSVKNADGSFNLGPKPQGGGWLSGASGGAGSPGLLAPNDSGAAAKTALQAPSPAPWPVIGATDSGAAVGGTPGNASGASSGGAAPASTGPKVGSSMRLSDLPAGTAYTQTGMNGDVVVVQAPGTPGAQIKGQSQNPYTNARSAPADHSSTGYGSPGGQY